MRRSQQRKTLVVFLYAGILLSALHCLSFPAQSTCRDPDVVRGFGSVAHAAEADATIQYLGHSFFLITTVWEPASSLIPWGPDGIRPRA